LITKLEIKDKEISLLKNEADKLTDYAIEIRYPDEWFEVTTKDAKEAYKIANKVKAFVLDKIKL